MGWVQEFKEFTIKGNVIDLAVGVIIGGAFGKIVSSLVADIMMPPISLLTGGVNFTDMKWVLSPSTIDVHGKTIAGAAIHYGNFIQNMFDFLIIALSVFLMIKAISHLRFASTTPESPPAKPAPTQEEVLLTEIRDLLKANRNN